MDLKKQLEFKGLVISRVPDKAKAIFKEIAKEEFADDYGQLLRDLVYSYLEYNRLKQMFFENELDIKLLLNSKEAPKEKEEGPKNLAGELIFKKEVKK